MIKKTRAFICGISGRNLKKNEISFLKKYKPWGIILFSRNIQSINQAQLRRSGRSVTNPVTESRLRRKDYGVEAPLRTP